MTTRLTGLIATFVLSAVSIRAADWRPVDPLELAQKTPRLDRGADAEAVFWDVRIEDSVSDGDLRLSLTHYIRIKIFTELGRDKYATVEIPLVGNRSVADVAGRTIKTDGTLVELRKDAIFDRELLKTQGLKVRGTTFTLPNVGVGDVIEYQYREIRNNEIASYMRLYLQREIPLWSVTYHLKPLQVPWLPYSMRIMPFQCKLPPLQREANGYSAITLIDVPAFQPEPYGPPEGEVRAWALIYYEADRSVDAARYWKEIGREDFARSKPLLNPDSQVKNTALELTSGLNRPEDKLAALDAFCRTKIANSGSVAFPMTAEERKAIKQNHSPGDTLKQKAGTGADVDMLLAAMANAAGFDARMARVADRSDSFFTTARATTYLLDNWIVAVNVNGQWKFFDPATPFLERGMLAWPEEGTGALISDPKEGFFAPTPYSEPSRSTVRRRGAFQLLANGTLEGSAEYSYTGHENQERKLQDGQSTPAQREERWKKEMESEGALEISGFETEGFNDPENPATVRFHLTAPGYATRTGRRILLQPSFFERSHTSPFTAADRKSDIFFQHGWVEDDEVAIDLPEGWELDQPAAPSNPNFGQIGNYSVQVQKSPDGRKLIYRRRFEWGRDNKILVPASGYAQLKKVFDFIQQEDNYTIALKAAGDGQ